NAAANADPDPTVRAAAQAAYDRLWPLAKRPRVAAWLSVLCPGCGHFYLRQPGTAALQLGAVAALLGGGLALAVPSADPNDSLRFKDARGPMGLQLLAAAQNVWMYSVFSSYRDARRLRHDLGYQYPSSQETLADLLRAPLRPQVIARPWF